MENEDKYKEIKAEILGEDSDDESGSEEDSDANSEDEDESELISISMLGALLTVHNSSRGNKARN